MPLRKLTPPGALLALLLTPALHALPIFQAPTISGLTGCGGQGSPTPAGSVAASVVNAGAGLTLSGSGSSTGVGVHCMTFNWFGPASGPVGAPPVAVPLAWDFTLGTTASTGLTGNLSITLYHTPYDNGPGQATAFSVSYDMFGPGQFTGANTITIPTPPGNLALDYTFYSVDLLVILNNRNGGSETVTVNIPAATSIDLGTVNAGPPGNGIPEPATWLSLSAGLAALALRRRFSAPR
jgi:hypothetical protein